MEWKQEEPDVQVSNLRLKFPGEPSLIFKDLSFSVPREQKVLLLGPSGCGKSTLLQVLSGIIPHSIEVPFVYDHIRLPSSWGFVFQDPDTQFCMPFVDEELAFVLENLSVPRERMESLMRAALADAGLQFDDLHTPIHTLSLGMKQRLALASVLLLRPDILFLDEPSAMLDPEGTAQIWDTVKQAAGSKTVIIVEHKIEHVANWVDRVVLFNNSGEIIADGVPSEIFGNYKNEIMDYGIWHPDVWHDYVEGESYRRMMRRRQEQEAALRQTPTPHIELLNFCGYYGDTAGINVPEATALPGEWIAVCGPNGAGKSTLLLSLMQLLPTDGSYCIRGSAVRHRSKRSAWRKEKRSPLLDDLAFVFQNPELQFITNSIYEEIAFSLKQPNRTPEQVERMALEVLETFDLQVQTGRHPYQLSSGQKRRLSVATAMVGEQSVLLLDEPTFGQDAKNTFAILEMLERIRTQGTTVIMVTHDPNIINYFANKIWKIENGKLSEFQQSDPMEASNSELLNTT